MRILVYGAGNIGSLYAAKLKASGHDVSILARGKRLTELRDHGVRLVDFRSGEPSRECPNVVERLSPSDSYEFVLVVLPHRHVSEALPILAVNHDTPNILFFGNNVAGPGEIVDALGPERVLLGFPGSAGVPHDGAIRYLILDRREQPTTIGEVDGTESLRIKKLAGILESSGFPVSICPNMDAWLKTHVAEILPAASAFYMAECNIDRLRENHEALLTLIRAIREGHRVLSALGIPIEPWSHRVFSWIPEFLLLFAIRRKLGDAAWSIKIGHAEAARHEMEALAREFNELVLKSGVNTPAINQLWTYLEDVDQSKNAQLKANIDLQVTE